MFVLRYGVLLAGGAFVLLAIIGTVSETGPAGVPGSAGADFSGTSPGFWAMIALAALTVFAFLKVFVKGITHTLFGWLSLKKDRLVALGLAALLCAVFLVA